jgi:hypothetical protein
MPMTNGELIRVLNTRLEDINEAKNANNTHVRYTKTGVENYILDFYSFKSYSDAVEFTDGKPDYKYVASIDEFINIVKQEIENIKYITQSHIQNHKENGENMKSAINSFISTIIKNAVSTKEEGNIKFVVYDAKTLEPHLYLEELCDINVLGEVITIGEEFYVDTIDDYIHTLRHVEYHDFEVPVKFIVSAPTKEIAMITVKEFVDNSVVDSSRIDIKRKKGN